MLGVVSDSVYLTKYRSKILQLCKTVMIAAA